MKMIPIMSVRSQSSVIFQETCQTILHSSFEIKETAGQLAGHLKVSPVVLGTCDLINTDDMFKPE